MQSTNTFIGINYRYFMNRLALSIFLTSLSISIAAQEKNDSITIGNALREVVISNFHINDSLLNATASIGILTEKEIARNNGTDIATALNMVSGVLMQSGALNTNRISIRGIGARTPYGTNKIRAFYGNIPLTSGDGETTIEDLNLENLQQIEIIKGPLSSLYGAGLGGAIIITPKSDQKTTAKIGSTYGSFGLMKSDYSIALHNKNADFTINYHKLESDGWRENSSYFREGFTIGGAIFKKPNSKLTFLGNYTYLKAYIPSSINKTTFDNSPESAAATWLAAKGFEQYHSYLAGLGYDFRIFRNLTNTTSIFTNIKKSNEPRPFDILKQDNKGYGARTQFFGNIEIGKSNVNYIFGGEYFRDGFSGGTFENLYEENNGFGSVEGDRLSEVGQDRKFYNLFAQLRYPIIKKLEVQAGLNVNKTKFKLDSTFPIETSASETYAYDAIWSPQISLFFKSDALQTFYASASRGFSLPSVEETLTINGLINSDIKPESGYSIEVGGKFYFLNRHLYTEASIYRMQIKDLLVARRVGDDQYVGINAGATLHQGIEVLVNYNTKISNVISVNTYFSGSFGQYTFQDFQDNGNDNSDKDLTGVPDSKVNAGITFGYSGVYLSGDFQFTDKIPLNDSNALYNDAYRLLNLKAGYRFSVFQNLISNIALGVNNVTNEHYASMVLVNATAFGNNTPRYYYPGMPIHYYGSFSFNYLF